MKAGPQAAAIGGGVRPVFPNTLTLSRIILIAGVAALTLPTMFFVASQSWSTEQGAHGPIVLATAFWLLSRQWRDVKRVAEPGKTGTTLLLLLPLLAIYVLARVTGTIEIEGAAMYACLLAIFYGLAGARAMKLVWFPLLYLAFIFPPPDTLVALITQPLKIWISEAAVQLLGALGYPVASSGVTIQIAQYQVLVAAACAGLNSMISLTAIGLFYVYVRHNANWRYAALLTTAIIPVAILANFIRVMLLILITYHLGEAAAQGFLHNFAGILLFTLSLLGIFLVDKLAKPLRRNLEADS